jgi:uracil phosphoribosyltransferase
MQLLEIEIIEQVEVLELHQITIEVQGRTVHMEHRLLQEVVEVTTEVAHLQQEVTEVLVEVQEATNPEAQRQAEIIAVLRAGLALEVTAAVVLPEAVDQVETIEVLGAALEAQV